MRRGRKRGLVFLLCAALVFSCCPASFAAESAESSGAGPNSGEGTGNYEYVIPMEHEFVFWNEAAQRFLTRDDNKLTLYDTEGRRLTDAYDSLSYMKKSGMWMASEGSERIFLNDDGEIQETFEIPEDRHIMSADDGIITVMDLTPPRRKRPDRGGKLIRAMSSSMMKREISWEAFSIRNIPPAGSL